MNTRIDVQVGPFRILEKLGSGGMADVYLAEHGSAGSRVALKLITTHRAGDETFQREFQREVQASARLNHPGIVRVYDYGRVERSTERFRADSPYLVMEVADRGSLDSTRPQSWSALRRIVFQLLDALAYSHARDVVHRDIKPANVLLSTEPNGHVRAKLTDFGIAFAHSPEARPEKGMLSNPVGTFRYMPPEQLEGRWRQFGPWTDLYALGCSIWQLATGNPPFLGTTAFMVAMQQMQMEPPDFEPDFDVPVGLEPWLRRLLEKQPGNRYRCAADAALAFAVFAQEIEDEERLDSSSDILVDQGGATTVMTNAQTWVLPTTGPDDALASKDLESRATTVLEGMTRRADGAPRKSRGDERPPVPASWARREIGYADDIAGVGLGLFGLREIPFVDRATEREQVWSALREVSSRGSSRVVVFRGASGTGKSRIAEWASQRAAELGAASVMRVHHTPSAGTPTGLHDLLERHLVTWRLEDQEELRSQARWRLTEFAPESIEPTALDSDVRAAVAMLEDGGGLSTTERVETAARLIEQASGERPVLVWLDDIQWDVESLSLLERFAMEERNHPVLVVATAQEEALAELPEIAARLDEVGSAGAVRMLRVRPLEARYQAELVRELLGLEPDVSSLVARATAGNPLFAIQLVGDWVQRGVLESTPNGFALMPGVDAPEDLHSLWVRRVKHLTTRLGGEVQQAALELAAVLGDRVNSREWQAATAIAEIPIHPQLIATLVDSGMATRTPDGWAFVHTMLAKSLRRLAVEKGRWQRLNHAAGSALQVLDEDATAPRRAERTATHYLEGKRWRDALEPLAQAAFQKLAASEVREATSWIDKRAAALVSAKIPRTERPWVLQSLLAARLERGGASSDRAGEILDDALEIANQNDWPDLTARLLRTRGETFSNAGKLDEAFAAYNRALQLLDGTEFVRETYEVLESRAWVLKAQAKTAAARADLERALDGYRKLGDQMRELNVFNSLAFTFLNEGDYAASREVAEMGIELAAELGHRGAEAGCWTTLGEIERFEGKLADARRAYDRAEALDEMCGNKHVHLVRSNAVMVDVAAHDWEHALDGLENSANMMVAIGYDWIMPTIWLARAACFAGLGRWAEFDDAWERGIGLVAQTEMFERDDAWLAEIATVAAESSGDTERAIICQRWAVAHWRAIHDDRCTTLAEDRLSRLEAVRT